MHEVPLALRHLSFVTMFLSCLSASAQTGRKEFIRKDSVLGEAQSIFYDNDRHSKRYRTIADFRFDKFDSASYANSLMYIRGWRPQLEKRSPVIPVRKWVTLMQYKCRFYVYKPCDFLFHFMVSVNDSTYINWTGEGPEANAILSQKRVDKNTYRFTLSGMMRQNEVLLIHIIDAEKGIVVFEEKTDSGPHFYLMIDADKITQVPLIVNNCRTMKQLELEFETPDYPKLLQRH